MDVEVERLRQLGFGLADAGKGDSAARYAGCLGAAQLATRDDIHSGAEASEELQHRLIGVRLHGVADERIERRKTARECAVLGRHGGPGVAIERRPDLGRDGSQSDVFGVERAVPVSERRHGTDL